MKKNSADWSEGYFYASYFKRQEGDQEDSSLSAMANHRMDSYDETGGGEGWQVGLKGGSRSLGA